MASKKTFKSEVQQPRPAAASFISKPEAEGNPEGVELKSKRLNLLLLPSIFTGIKKIATMQRLSVNEVINQALGEYVEAHADLITKHDEVFTD